VIRYREILRLHAQGHSNRSIESSCSCGYSRNTVGDVLKRAQELQVTWPFERNFSDSELQTILFPEKNKSDLRKLPDCEYIHKEMGKSGVTLSLLGTDKRQNCRFVRVETTIY
jgi:hypothetical protein